MPYHHFTPKEHYVIAHMTIAGFSQREIGRRLGRHHRGIGREIRRNRPTYADDAVYWYDAAEYYAKERRRRPRHRPRGVFQRSDAGAGRVLTTILAVPENGGYNMQIYYEERRKGMEQNLILSDPAVMMGKAVVKGTRITVELIPEKLAAGETMDDLIEAYPRLTRDAIRAAIAFAADVLKSDVVYPAGVAA